MDGYHRCLSAHSTLVALLGHWRVEIFLNVSYLDKTPKCAVPKVLHVPGFPLSCHLPSVLVVVVFGVGFSSGTCIVIARLTCENWESPPGEPHWQEQEQPPGKKEEKRQPMVWKQDVSPMIGGQRRLLSVRGSGAPALSIAKYHQHECHTRYVFDAS